MTTTLAIADTHFDTPSECLLVATRSFDAPRALVWDAWTNPIHVPHWMTGPEGWKMPVCEIDLRVGGHWRYAWDMGDCGAMGMHGTYLEIVPGERLVSTERLEGGDWPETINTLELSEVDGKTLTVCTVRYPTQAARDAAMERCMLEGWAESYGRMAEYLPKLGGA